jgi:hypothetical protein
MEKETNFEEIKNNEEINYDEDDFEDDYDDGEDEEEEEEENEEEKKELVKELENILNYENKYKSLINLFFDKYDKSIREIPIIINESNLNN